MPLWLRFLITLAAVVAVGFLAGLLWNSAFSREMPAYLSGLLGGLAAMPIWELLKRVAIKPRA
jgi:hypothetical protein